MVSLFFIIDLYFGIYLLYFPSQYEEHLTLALVNKVEAIADMTSYNISPAMYFNDETNMYESVKMAVLIPDINCCEIFNDKKEIVLSNSAEKNFTNCDRTYIEKSQFDNNLKTYRSVKDITYNGVKLGTLIICADTKGLINDVRHSKQNIFIISSILLLIGLFFIFFVGYFISEPIKRITENMKLIAEGDLSKRSSIRTYDEIGLLSDSYNIMAENLESAYMELSELNLNLESRVVERTKELQNEISRRKSTEESLKESQSKLRNLSKHMENVREQERKHLAEQIHDELGQSLTALKIDLDWIYNKTEENQSSIRERIDSMIKIVESLIEQIRDMATELRPAMIDDFGLNSTIKWYIDDYTKSTNIKFNFTSNINEANIPINNKLIIFRIIKEAITNIIRHANAFNVDVVCEEYFDYFRISIYDDGIGISEEALKSPNSFGINTMKERAFALGGRIEFLNGVDNGTLVVLNFPK
jgi:signal transduction histidine kinase